MELFTGRVGLKLVRDSTRFSQCNVRLSRPLSACERTPRLGVTLSEIHGRFLLDRTTKGGNIGSRDPCNRCSFLQRRLYSDQVKKECDPTQTATTKPNIFQKMKQMTKDYWHVLIPVHVVTSVGWMLIFYTAAKNSVDVIWIMEKLRFSERYIEALRGSSAGFWAVAYALYKIFTPLRYTVTVGGTTLSIRYLNRMGIMRLKFGKNSAQKSQPSKPPCKDGDGRVEPPKT